MMTSCATRSSFSVVDDVVFRFRSSSLCVNLLPLHHRSDDSYNDYNNAKKKKKKKKKKSGTRKTRSRPFCLERRFLPSTLTNEDEATKSEMCAKSVVSLFLLLASLSAQKISIY